MERGKTSFARAAAAGVLAEVVLFAGGLSWLAVLTHSFAQAARWGLYWFVFAEVIKVMLAAASLNRMATCPQGAGMSFVETPSGTTAALVPETKDSARGNASTREISIAHSPDSDDAFMFYALATNKVRVPGLRFTHTLCDIETPEPEGTGRRRRL